MSPPTRPRGEGAGWLSRRAQKKCIRRERIREDLFGVQRLGAAYKRGRRVFLLLLVSLKFLGFAPLYCFAVAHRTSPGIAEKLSTTP